MLQIFQENRFGESWSFWMRSKHLKIQVFYKKSSSSTIIEASEEDSDKLYQGEA